MDWQQPVALAIVAAAALGLFLGKRRARQSPLKREGLCGGCAHGQTATPEQSSILFHARKGERSSITVRQR